MYLLTLPNATADVAISSTKLSWFLAGAASDKGFVLTIACNQVNYVKVAIEFWLMSDVILLYYEAFCVQKAQKENTNLSTPSWKYQWRCIRKGHALCNKNMLTLLCWYVLLYFSWMQLKSFYSFDWRFSLKIHTKRPWSLACIAYHPAIP